jgi:uncharacterized protein
MVEERRVFEGVLPVAGFGRLRPSLADDAGQAQYRLEFGRNELGDACLDVQINAPLTLVCQRTLDPFVFAAGVHSRLGLIPDEDQEAALGPGFEPLLVAGDGRLSPADVIEDELLLALPLVPVSPTSEWPEHGRGTGPVDAPDTETKQNPFAVLRELKKH